MQVLSDLTVLPDYEEGYAYWRERNSSGAPVGGDGKPVYYATPKSWEESYNDGERWRWAMAQAIAKDAGLTSEIRYYYANFLNSQFGVETMSAYGWYFRAQDDAQGGDKGAAMYALHTLDDDETIARLATGIKRFTLPDEFNPIKVYQQVAEGGGSHAKQALHTLGSIFENRRQYDRAAEYWQRAGNKDRVAQILGNWGTFEPVMTQPAGKGARVAFRFRNGKKISFEAYAIKVDALLNDMKAYVKSNPRQLDWQKMRISDIGYHFVQDHPSMYLGAKVAAWEQNLSPRPNHFDARVTVNTPLQQAGAYLLIGTMADGNTSRIILWVADTVIIKKALEKQVYYYVADAVTGKPLAKATLDFFGYNQNWIQNKEGGGGQYEIKTKAFTELTDADGQLLLKPEQQPDNHQWVVTATLGTHRAFLGFTNVWYPQQHDRQYETAKAFFITDRPVYRPDQSVQFKCWVNTAKYDQEGNSAFAGKPFTVRINNPKGEKVFEKTLTADEFGGFDDKLALDSSAALGVYQIYLINGNVNGGATFRVEEYKKPEFEVSVAAPTEPVMLGETITATVKANYLFGAPVTEAKVKYKVLRSSYSADWYPAGRWDWFYGTGYWWFASDTPWYPGWRDWGCRRPIPFWWHNYGRSQPEVIAEVEAPIGADGTVKIDIDTALAKAVLGDTDHRYEITAEVTDASRRTIVGQGAVLVARKPFKVYAWVDRGHYSIGDTIRASFNAHTLNSQPVKGTGLLRLLRVTYRTAQPGDALQPVETEVQRWHVETNDEGQSSLQMKASRAGQYRVSYTVTDAKNHSIEGGYLFTVRGEGFSGSEFRFDDLELIPDKREYRPGESVDLLINTNRTGAALLLFTRPTNGVYLPPKVLRLNGKSTHEAIAVAQKDMPNFFVEAVTIADGQVHTETREIVVPPEKRVLDVQITPSKAKYQPGEQATVTVKLTDANGKPFVGSAVVSLYDKAVEYISGGSNVPNIKEFFWKWRRNHYPQTQSSLDRGSGNLARNNETRMNYLGIFGYSVADEGQQTDRDGRVEAEFSEAAAGGGPLRASVAKSAPASPGLASVADAVGFAGEGMNRNAAAEGGAPDVEPTVRQNFADTALWVAAVQTNANGVATVSLTMPENLTTWKTKVWAMGAGATCGEGSAEVITSKNLIIRLQAPRFFVQKDEVVLSANVHNFLTTKKSVRVLLEVEGGCLSPRDGQPNTQMVTINPNGEARVDWRVKVTQPGQATVRMKALTDEESDAMQMKFPVYVHGMLKTESFSGVIRPEGTRASITMYVPAERRPAQSRLEVRYSPTLAGAMVDALPYLVDYPYDNTDATIGRFLPTVLTQKVLLGLGVDLKDIQQKRANLNAQEIGDDVKRAQDWQRIGSPSSSEVRNPVFDHAEVDRMVKAGLERLASFQCGDGGWGWFSGWGERSWPHTTALVVHGLQITRANGVSVPTDMVKRGVDWLKGYQAEELRRLKLPKSTPYHKDKADALDAFVYMVLVDEKLDNGEMRDFLYRDRNELPVYAKSMFGIALHRIGDIEKRDMLIRNIEQYLVQDDENQTAYLKLPQNNWWWHWYGSEYEAQAYYLKLLTVTDVKSEKASRLVKYLLNNRKHATYWNSARDTAIVVEAFADYLKATGEMKPNMTVTVRLDGKTVKTVTINAANLFSFDNKFVLEGQAVTSGRHTLEIVKTGTGPLYFNAYLTNFTLEDPISRAGLEIKVNRTYYKLTPVKAAVNIPGTMGQVYNKRVEKYERRELHDGDVLKSGDLVEVELEIDSKNDYEYLLFEDMKASGFEPVEVRSGYSGNGLGAYMELRDERVCFFVRTLARGDHSVSYRLRAEIPGIFHALPTRAGAIYAPELKANSDEIKLGIED
ncbi:MAG: alpha-2-macroglobulin family protein [Armatimonadota bacterium]